MIIKYRVRGVWVFSGIMWLTIAILNIVVLIMSREADYHLFFTSLIIFIIILSVFLSFAHFTIQNIDYIRINKDSLSIHRGFPIPREKVEYSNVEKGIATEDKLVLVLKDEREVELKSKFMRVSDFEKLTKALKKYVSIE
ncbi:MAG: hypothetical protein LRY73_09670 [Bacillus sp. (in: Bacteria)]|nr:hypothetical protein [Bacillus sp. (in: firmicutes)]